MTRLEFFRRRAGLTVKEVADRMGIAPANISAIERGWRRPWPKFKKQAAEILQVPYEQLWEENPELDRLLEAEGVGK